MASLHGLMAIPLRAPSILLAVLLLVGALGTAQAATVTTFNSVDVPKSVPNLATASPTMPLGGPANSIVTVSGITAPISKVTVSVYIQHGWTSDLRITLLAPGGTPALVLANAVGGQNYTLSSQRGYGDGLAIPTGPPTNPPGIGRVVFDDAGTVVISAIQSGTGPGATPGAPAVPEYYIPSGIYRPQVGSLLSIFNDLTAAQINGNWTLRLEDSVPGDGDGTLIAWSLVVTDPGIHTWTGGAGAGNGNWSNPLNWQASNPPTLAENRAVIILPPGSQGATIGFNDIGDLKVGSLTVNEGYVVSGPQKLTMAAGGTISATGTSNGTATIGMDVDLSGATTIDAATGITLALNGVVDDNLVATGSMVFNGPGTLRLAGNNGYAGATTVNAGTVEISNANSLGTVGGTTTVVAGASVVLTAAVATNEPLVLAGTGSAGQGALATTVSATWAGPITLAPGITGFGSTSPAALTIGNLAVVAAGSYGFSKVGTGDVILNAALPATSVLAANGGGTLTLGAAQPNLVGISLTGGTTIASGANLMTLAGGISCSASAATSTITGQLAVGTAARVLDVAAGSSLTFPNGTLVITGAGGFAKTGAGTLSWSTASPTVPFTMLAGTLTGNGGSMGALTVAGGIIERTGNLATGALNLGAGSLLRYTGPEIDANGAVTLGGGLLQPLVATGTVISKIPAGAVTGIFSGMTNFNGVNYGGGDGNDVVLASLGATTVSFNPTAYSVAENGGTVTVTLIASAASGIVKIGSFGGTATAGADFVLPVANLDFSGGTTQTVTLPIANDNISEGDEIANLVIIPQSGCHLASVASASAAVTITDDDDDDAKKCGFGTGLTVFFLFGFGLLLRLGLRRRR
jgi:autotransporter-associated beta strand protein